MRLFVLILFLIAASPAVSAQERVTTFGLQFKPVIPSNLLRAGEVSLSDNGVNYTVDQKLGYSLGGVVRRGVTRWFSVETGISYVRRNFAASVYNDAGTFSDTTRFRIVGYEIPVLGMVYVQLSDQIFMDAAFGLSMDMFPSNVSSGNSQAFYQKSFRNGWLLPGLIANVGWEWRTRKSGYFYIGASYHRPFIPIYDSHLYYTHNGQNSEQVLQLSGNYLTLDLRFFFHEDPEPKKEKVREEDLPHWMKGGRK